MQDPNILTYEDLMQKKGFGEVVRASGPFKVMPLGIAREQRMQSGDIILLKSSNTYYGVWGSGYREDRAMNLYTIDPATTFTILPKEEAAEYEAKMKEAGRFNLRNVNADRGQDCDLLIGSDPEIFAVDAKGTVIPAFDFLPGEKERVFNPKPGHEKTWPFWDGFQAEFNIPQKYCHAWVVDHIQSGLQEVYRAARKKDPKAQLTHESVMDIPQAMMKKAEAEHTELGCAPSLNIYPGVEPISIPDSRDLAIRFAGFHIHYGYGKQSKAEVIARVRSMDRIAAVVMTSVLAGLEDTRRRHFYGRAGEHRLPKHGLEYRVMSSTAMVHPAITHFCLDLTRFASHLVKLKLDSLWEVPSGDEQIQHIINAYDIDEARKLIKLNEKMLRSMISITYGITPGEAESKKLKWLMDLVRDGAKNCIDTDMTKNWRLDSGEWVVQSAKTDSCVSNYTVK